MKREPAIILGYGFLALAVLLFASIAVVASIDDGAQNGIGGWGLLLLSLSAGSWLTSVAVFAMSATLDRHAAAKRQASFGLLACGLSLAATALIVMSQVDVI